MIQKKKKVALDVIWVNFFFLASIRIKKATNETNQLYNKSENSLISNLSFNILIFIKSAKKKKKNKNEK